MTANSESDANARGVLSKDPYVAARQISSNPDAQHYYADGNWTAHEQRTFSPITESVNTGSEADFVTSLQVFVIYFGIIGGIFAVAVFVTWLNAKPPSCSTHPVTPCTAHDGKIMK